MNRRSVLMGALGIAATPFAALSARTRRVTATQLQISPLAGFQFHAGENLWPQLQVGQPLQLVREPTNPHDANAVRVDWNGQKLGYVPREENTAVAQLLDRKEALAARIDALAVSDNPWERMRVAIDLERA